MCRECQMNKIIWKTCEESGEVSGGKGGEISGGLSTKYCLKLEGMSGLPPGGGGAGPPHSSPQGGVIPPCWKEKLKYIPYFTVISVQIGHFKHQNLKL